MLAIDPLGFPGGASVAANPLSVFRAPPFNRSGVSRQPLFYRGWRVARRPFRGGAAGLSTVSRPAV